MWQYNLESAGEGQGDGETVWEWAGTGDTGSGRPGVSSVWGPASRVERIKQVIVTV